jgi:large subunit ribosomal protein L17
MDHRRKYKKLSLPTDQRLALLKNLSVSLVENGKIVTTSTRAKALKMFLEKLITKAKTDTVHNRRIVFKAINNADFVKNVFDLAKGISRDGGYLKINKCGFRRGDSAELSQVVILS